MILLEFYLLNISLFGLLIISIYAFLKRRNIRNLILYLVAIAILWLLFYKSLYTDISPIPKGIESTDIYLLIILYFFMILGMLAKYGYEHFSQNKDVRKDFDWGVFLAPIFVSPIIFLPLLVVFQNAEISLQNINLGKLTIYFIAFENGFLWKEFFDNRRRLKKSDS